MSALDDAVQFYVDRLVLQYRGKPNAEQTIAILLKQAVADLFALQVQSCFTLGSAVGPQLDILGKYIGVPRNIGPPSTPPYFGFALAAGGGNTNGLTVAAGGVNTTGIFYRTAFPGFLNTNLPDTSYQFVLQLKVILNASNGTLSSIINYLNMFFPDTVSVVDNEDMTLTYSVSENVPLDVTTLEGYLPKPMGVGITVNVIGASDDRVLADGVTTRVLDDDSTIRVIIT